MLLAPVASAQVPSFAAPVTAAAQQSPLAITAADFNKDGFQDLAVANAETSTISIFLGNGKGQFSAGPVLNEPAGCEGGYVTAGNFTGAASPDILAVCPLGAFVVFPNAGKGAFGPPLVTSLPSGAWVGNLLLGSIHPAIADFNGDGHLDIALPLFDQDSFTGSWYALSGKGDGTFGPGISVDFYGVIPISVVVGDFNGDKKPDLVSAGYDENNNLLLQFDAGIGDGSFAIPRSVILPQAAGSILLAADVNGDGKLDIIVAGSSLYENLNNLGNSLGGGTSQNPNGSAALTVLLGDGTGGFNQVFNALESTYVSGAVLADVLGRGKLDLVETIIAGNFLAGTAPTGAVSVRLSNGDGTFGSPMMLNVPATTIPTDVTAADFNGDGLADIAFAALPSKGVTINLQGLDGLDGLLQQVLSQLPNGSGEVLLNTAAAVTPPALTFTDTNAASFATGPVAKGSIVTAFGTNIAAQTANAMTVPLPLNLGGDTISIQDAGGATTAAPMFYVSQGQINYEIPDSVASGSATVTIQSGSTAFTATQQIVAVAPGIFATNGVAVGSVIRVVNGVQQYSSLTQNGAPASIDLSGGQTFVVLYGTGIHNHVSPVVAHIGNTQVTAAYAGVQGYYVGEDQINIQLPASLAGAGVIPVSIVVDGQTSNPVNIQIQ
ncbi:MAG TPA: FG-GAP-like repeat-containing protein [Bryobacteraceae bacterium]|nr:FG-GAP-like repeat-containing protein [Bryobacteraceae bacterium]